MSRYSRCSIIAQCYFLFRIMEALLIAIVTSFCVFLLSTFLGTCVPLLPSNRVSDFTNSTREYFCPKDGIHTHELNQPTRYYIYYNDMATLVFNNQEDTIKQLFHQNGIIIILTCVPPALCSIKIVFVARFCFSCNFKVLLFQVPLRWPLLVWH